MKTNLSASTEDAVAEYIAEFRNDPLGFVMAIFPWGEKGTPLENRKGPEKWQAKILTDLGKHSFENARRKQQGLDMIPWRSAVVSGHGVGKSALVSWIQLWIMSTRVNARGVTTANTGDQLETKTWPELAYWLSMSINSHWFVWTATSLYFAPYPENRRKNYMLNALTVSKEKTEAFAGLHNSNSAVLIIFDEASGIESNVWQVIEGALTDGEAFFFAFGNPTRSDGEFRECFRKNKDYYYTYHVDSREVSHTNKIALQAIIDRYGPDSDVSKVRVYGEFPDRSFDGFISEELYNTCSNRKTVRVSNADPLVLGVDVAGMGDDSTVLYLRKGFDAKSNQRIKLRKNDPETIARAIADMYQRMDIDAIFLENVGPGQGVISLLKLWNIPHIPVPVGAPSRSKVYQNIRMEIWANMQAWMREGGSLPDEPELFKQATSIRYKYTNSGKMLMESKREMKARGLESPDDMDALALTFYQKVSPKKNVYNNMNTSYNTDYQMF